MMTLGELSRRISRRAWMVSGVAVALAAGCGSSDEPRMADEPEPAQTAQFALSSCDPAAPFGAPVAAFTGTMNADGLTFAPDGKTAYISGVGLDGYDIFVATRASLNEAFGTPQPVQGSLNGPGDQRAPTLEVTPNGHRLYYANAPAGARDVVFSDQLINGQFGSPQAMASGFNYPGGVHDQDPFLWGTDTILFASERPDGAQRDIYSASVNGSTFSGLQKLADAGINLGSEDFRPVLTPDGRTLYFASKRGGIGGDNEGDVWVTTRSSLGAPFGQPQNIWAMNSSRAEFPVAVSADGCTVYFASNEELPLDAGDNYRLYEARRGTSIPPQVSVSINIIGGGSITAPVNCSTGNAGTCTLTGVPGTTTSILASSQARWTGICTGQGGTMSSDAVVAFAESGVCTVTFPDGTANGVGGACSLSMDCQTGLECKLGVCRCVPGTPGCGSCDLAAPFDPPTAAFTGTSLVDGITFSADDKTAYLSGKLPPETSSQIYVTTRDSETAPFRPLELFSVANTPNNSERAPSLSADGSRLYFGRYASSAARFQLMVTSYNSTTQQWGAPLSLNVNQSGLHDQDPFFLSTTNQLFFAAEPSDGIRDLRVSPLVAGSNPHTSWTGVSFIPPLGLAEDEYRPVLSPDGLTIYLASTRPGIGGDNGGDIWVARRTPNNPSFGPLTNLGILNTNRVEFPAGISNDGCTLYFASNRDTSITNDYRLYQATRGASTLTSVSTTLRVVGTGSVVTSGYECSTSCAFQGVPDATVILTTSAPAIWSGSCAANGSNPNSDGTLVFTRNGTCTVTFANGSPQPQGRGCTSALGCQSGLECTLNVCRCSPGTTGCGCADDGDCDAELACIDGQCLPSDCPFDVPMMVIGRNGHDSDLPFGIPDILDIGLTDERTTRLFLSAGFNRIWELGELGDNSGWNNEISVTAAAWGDFDGDKQESAVIGLTSSPAGQTNRLTIYKDQHHVLSPLKNLLGEWGESYYPTAIATGDIDNDGRDEIAIGRQAAEYEVFILDDADNEFRQILNPWPNGSGDDIGARTVRSIAIGDVGDGGKPEILVARDGQSGSDAGRIVVYRHQENGFGKSEFANWGGGTTRGATAVAIGDLEGDGVPEIAVGRNAGDGGRVLIYKYDGGQWNMPGNAARNWGIDRAVTALAFGDLDGNGDDELVVGRNACSGIGCTAGPRVIVYDTPYTDGELRVLAELGGGEGGWGDERSVMSLVVNDIDDDSGAVRGGGAEIIVGRSEGGGARVIVYDDLRHDFRELYRTGGVWGDDRNVRAIAVSKQRVCQSRPASPVPQGIDAANAAFDLRLEEAIDVWLAPLITQLEKDPASLTAEQLAKFPFGTWGEGDHVALRMILAGAAAIVFELPERSFLIEKDFAGHMNRFFETQVRMYKDAGTNDDFDFNMIELLEVAYFLRDVPHPSNTEEFLLSSESLFRMLLVQQKSELNARGLNGTLPETIDNMSENSDFVIPYAGGWVVHRPMAPVLPVYTVPETENHMLMINTWAYLVNQWIVEGQRGLIPVVGAPDQYVNAGRAVEMFLLAATGRFLQNGAWETNARPYQAYTIRALQLLATYASEPRVRAGAENALDTILTKFTFQSLFGKRMPPMRRNWEKRYYLGAYQNDYVAAQLGILTGATVFDASADCQGRLCAYLIDQPKGFALDAAIMATVRQKRAVSEGRPPHPVPPVIHDFALRAGISEPGFGAWARMQDRFSERHYIRDGARYPVANPLPNQPNLNEEIAAGTQPIEPQAEFYFLTRDFLISAGGRGEHYSGFGPLPDTALFVSPFDVAKLKYGTDFVSKPTTLIGNRDLGYWTETGGAAQETLLVQGADDGAYSDNRGVYKNVAFGSRASTLPAHWQSGPSATIGEATFTVVNSNTTQSVFEGPAPFLLVVDLPPSWGLWEVVPRRPRFPDEEAVLAHAVSVNAQNSMSQVTGYEYTTATSGEKLTLNTSVSGARPFLAIDDNPGLVSRFHVTGVPSSMPLLDVRQVNADYVFTGVSYVCASGDGRVIINNPTLGRGLILDSRNHLEPTRREFIPDMAMDPCTDGVPNAFADPGN